MKKMLGCLLAGAMAFHSAYAIEKSNVSDATTIKVTPRQPVFSIKLNSNRTTGYSWSIQRYDSALLIMQKHEYVASKSNMIGAPGYQVWTFSVKPAVFKTPAKTIISFVYARPWEKNKPVHKIDYTIVIGEVHSASGGTL